MSKVIHNSKAYTVTETFPESGVLYTSDKEGVMLNKADLTVLKRTLSQLKSLKLVDPNLDIERSLDTVCQEIFKAKKYIGEPFISYTPN